MYSAKVDIEEQLISNSETKGIVKDNRCKAIVAMNFVAIGGVGQSVLFKIVSREGVSLLDYQLLRNVGLLLFSIITLIPKRVNLLDEFPATKKLTLFIRILAGQLTFIFLNLSVMVIPISMFMIIFQTNAFWTSIMGLLVNEEPIYIVEATGMVLCFCVVCFLSFNSSKEEADGEATETHSELCSILLAIGASLLFAIGSITTRRLKEVHSSAVTFYHSLTGATIMLIYLIIEGWMIGCRMASYTRR